MIDATAQQHGHAAAVALLRNIEVCAAVSGEVRYADLGVLLGRLAAGLDDPLLAAHCRVGASRYRQRRASS